MAIYIKTFFLILISFWSIKQINYFIDTLSIFKSISLFFILIFLIVLLLSFLCIFNRINRTKFLQYFFIVFFSFFASNLFFDLYLDNSYKKKSDFNLKSIEIKNSKKFDLRTQKEVVLDLQKQFSNVYPVTFPKHKLNKIKNTSELFPLSGISKSKTVFCNESGEYSIYKSDRYGFNNKDIIYEKFDKKRIMLIGDSFVHGACVNEDENISSYLNKLNIYSFSISYGGNGPLLELASLVEYINIIKPEVIIWFYSENDLFDLNQEKKSEVLIKYLNIDNFNQKLVERQNEIDDHWKKLLINKFNVDDYVYYSKKRSFSGRILRKLERAVLFKPLRDVIKNYYLSEVNQFYISQDRNNFDLFERIIKKAKNISHLENASIHFVYLPFYGSLKDSPPLSKDIIIELVKQNEINVLDFYSFIKKEEIKLKDIFPLNRHGHYNSQGYKFLADFIYENIKN